MHNCYNVHVLRTCAVDAHFDLMLLLSRRFVVLRCCGEQIADDGALTTLQKVKLGMKGDSGVQQAMWVGDGLLATSSSEEPYVR